jgi:ubiquinone/menaquinone biosynthesis C-methylase UbiE
MARGELETRLAVEYGMTGTGVDISKGLLKEAKETLKDAGVEGVGLAVADGESLPFSDESFDVVIFSESIGHMDIERAVSEANRVLRPGGRIYITNYTETDSLHRKLGYRFYSADKTKEALEGADLTEITEEESILYTRLMRIYIITAKKPLNTQVPAATSHAKKPEYTPPISGLAARKGEEWAEKSRDLLAKLDEAITEAHKRSFRDIDKLFAGISAEMIRRTERDNNAIDPQDLIDDLTSLAKGYGEMQACMLVYYQEQAKESGDVKELQTIRKDIEPLTVHLNIWVRNCARSFVEEDIPAYINKLRTAEAEDATLPDNERSQDMRQEMEYDWQDRVLGIADAMIAKYNSALGARIAHRYAELGDAPGIASIYPLVAFSSTKRPHLIDDVITLDRDLIELYGDRYIRALNFLVPHECGHTLLNMDPGNRVRIISPDFDPAPFTILDDAENIADHAREIVIDRIGYELTDRVYAHNTLMLEHDYNSAERYIIGLMESVRIYIDISHKKTNETNIRKVIIDLSRLIASLSERANMAGEIRDSILQGADQVIDLARSRVFELLGDDKQEREIFERLVTAYRKVLRDAQVEFTLPPSTATSHVAKAPVDKPEMEALANMLAQKDADMLLKLLGGEYIDPKFFEGVHLRVTINNARMPQEPEERDKINAIVKLWLETIESRVKDFKGQIAYNRKESDSLITMTVKKDRYGPVIGECAVETGVDIDSNPRLFGMLSIAFAGSLIPKKIPDNVDDMAEYDQLVYYIDDHHILITGERYLEPEKKTIYKNGTIQQKRDIINKMFRSIPIDLPDAQKFKYDKDALKAFLTAV